LLKSGFKVIVDLASEKIPATDNCTIVRRSYMQANRQTVQAYIDSEIEAIAAAKKDKAGAVKVLGKLLQLDDQDALGQAYDSDVTVDLLRTFGIEYVALNPGASYRGLHDSLVNYGGNTKPEIILCTHEEIAVSIAHGYAKVTGQPMAAAVHDVVGLLHATMTIYYAQLDRAPVLVLGATGP